MQTFQKYGKYKEEFFYAVKPPLQVYDYMNCIFVQLIGMQTMRDEVVWLQWPPWERVHNSHVEHSNLINNNNESLFHQ